ncbi:MAG: AAA family ATPase [Chloroflexia bacterium]
MERALSYAGVWITPEVVNREAILQEIYRAVEGQGTHVIYLTGPGGIGKTFLLREVLSRLRPGGAWHRPEILAMQEVVDFYHTTTHTSVGFTRSLSEALERAAGENLFPKYDEKYQAFEKKKYDLAGMLKELSTLRDAVLQAFLDDLNELAGRHRLVLTLDTAERLIYGEDPVQERLGWEPEMVEVLPWLLEHFFPRLQNTVVLLAGQPAPRLEKDLREALADRLIHRELGPFNAEETAEYFAAVARTARSQAEEYRGRGQEKPAAWLERFAARVEGIPTGVRQVAWRYTEGRPILLALMVDYLSNSDRLHPRLLEAPEEVKKRSPEEIEAIREEVERDLVRFWQEAGREADVAVEALAWARRGLDAGLLAPMAGVEKEKAERLLEQVRNLAFVKVRPADDRFFLHDEMYELLDRHLLSGLPEARREQMYGAILEEYGKRILAQRDKVRELWVPRREGMPEEGRVPPGTPRRPDYPEQLARETDRLYNLMSEEVYYRLRSNPVGGFQTWRLYTKEAFWVGEESLDHLLRSEMLLFLKEREGQETFDGLRREEVAVVMALQRMERLNRRAKPQTVELARQMREQCADLLQAAGPLAPIALDIAEGDALAYLGTDLGRAEELLRGSLDALEAFSTENPLERWWCSIYRAEVHNDLGYLYRIRGLFHRAVEEYRRAVDMWRRLEDEEGDALRRLSMRAQHANTLNNLSWALAERGELRRATSVCSDALEMRRALGPAAPVAFSHNTLGMILLRDGKPHQARVHCERALGIFRDLDQPRGVGLASIALAEALRRMSEVEYLYAPEEIADFLRRAASLTEDAVRIFEEVVPEHPRLVEALIERGCVYRFWAWLRPQYEPAPEQKDPSPEELFRRSERDLSRAMELAGEDLPFRRLDAHVNRAWLYYYVARSGLSSYKQAEGDARKAIEEVPEAYRPPGKLPNPDDPGLPDRFYWFLLGKAYLLLGQIYMQQFEERKMGPEEALPKGGRFYTLALAYDELYAEDFRDIRRAVHRIYGRTKRRNREELALMRRGMEEVAREFNLKRPTRLERELREYGISLGEGR